MKKITAGLDVSKYSCLSQEVLHEGMTPMALNLSVRKNLGVTKVNFFSSPLLSMMEMDTGF